MTLLKKIYKAIYFPQTTSLTWKNKSKIKHKKP